ncbi:C40 family peptidase [Peribacillus simplex]|uniref:D-gamma-glutamyl-meso-diaminopimelic acid endopeptidase CwlS n=1 Tax=Peribacillus simplex TaxID=1478 RepID=A0A9W4KUB3_9BACI|nr:C40 family peptidase [Peribacillus simplex]CAH0152246.1 D-gamma-glutamyl-meso-diaminopimelic acid endopeptidase CwlS [Peribacillus simplex]
MFNGKISCMILTLVFMVSFTFFPGLKAEAADPVHTVISGETVKSIAKTYDISAEQLMKTNGLPDDKLFAGQKLTIIQTAYTPSNYQWSERGKKIANYAKSFIGFKKTAGEETPEKGFDSSGLIHWVLSQQNVPVDRLTVDGFYKQGMDTATPKTGDIIFFLEKDSLKVVTAGIYVGENQFVNSGYGAETVQVRSTKEDYFAKYQVAYKTYTPKGEHIVQTGETLKSISENYSISMSTINSRNALSTDELMQGQYLQLYSNPLYPFYVNQEAAYDKAYDVIKYAYTLRGFTYVFGGEDPMIGMDCSGFIYWVMKEQGLSVKRDSAADYFSLVPKIENPKAGDLVFFSDTGTRLGVTHVGIYLGDGRFLNTTENTGVHISNLSSGYFAEKFESFGQAESLID